MTQFQKVPPPPPPKKGIIRNKPHDLIITKDLECLASLNTVSEYFVCNY